MDPASAAALAKQGSATIAELMAFLNECKDRGVNSLTEFTKKTNIMSRVYIEDTLAQESAIHALMKMLNQIYCAYVFNAIGMNGLVESGKTVRDLMNVVSTEEFHAFVDLAKEQFGDAEVSIKDISMEGKDENVAGNKAEWKDMEAASANLYCGRILEVTVPAAKAGDDKVRLYFYVQLLPYLTPANVLEGFINLNFAPPTNRRWWAYKAGEISFWKDFIFECDRVAKRKKALQADKDGILREMELRKISNASKAAKNYSPTATTTSLKRNAANSLIIIGKQTLDRVSKEVGFDIKRYDQRQRLFNDTMSMIICVYDNMYNTVDMYFNGIESRGEYTVDMIEKAGKKSDGIDMKTLLQLLNNGNAPRF